MQPLVTLLLAVLAFHPLQEQDNEKTAESKRPDWALPMAADRTLHFTTDQGTWLSLDVSPSGRSIVFELLGDLYTIPVTGGKATQITQGLALDSQPRYSNDGKRIVFVSDRSGSENVWLLDMGSALVTDTTAAHDSTGLKALTKGSKMAYASPEWTPDGKYIVVSKGQGIGGRYQFWLYHIDGGSGMALPLDNKDRTTMGAAFGPDGRYIYMTSKIGRWGYNLPKLDWQIALYDREESETFRLTNQVGGGVRPAVSPDGKWLVYGSRKDAKTGYRVRNLETGNEQWLTHNVQRDDMESRFTRDFMPGYSFTPDSKSIIAAVDGKLTKIAVPSGRRTAIPMTVDVAVDVGPKVKFEKRVEVGDVSLRQVRWPVLSPNGKILAFTALDKLYTRNMKTGKTARLGNDAADQFDPVWSPDGKWLAYVTWSEKEGGHLYKISARGGKARKLTKVAGFYSEPVWTPNGKNIVVVKGPWQQRQALSYFNYVAGQGEDLVLVPAGGGRDKKIAPYKGANPHFADKADRLYVYERPTGLVSMRLDGTDRKVHLKVTGLTPPRGTQEPISADMIIMGKTGEFALAMSANHVYRVTVPPVGGEKPPVVSILKPDEASFPVKKLTQVGAQFVNWGKGTDLATWGLGNTVFIYDFAAAKKFEDEQKEAARLKEIAEKAEKAAGEKEDDEDEDEEENEADDDDDEEQVYEAEEIAIELTFPREMGKGTVVLRGGRILTMAPGSSNDGIIENGAIVVKDNRIVEVGTSAQVATPPGAREIDVTGKTLLPGFVDTHAHMWPAWGVHRGQVWEYLANLAYGVITTHDVQTSTTDVLTYSDLVATGRLVGPRVHHTGPGIFGTDDIKSLKEAQKVLKRYADYYRTNTIKQYVSGDRNTRQWIIMAAAEREIMPTTEGALDMKLDFTQIVDGYPGHEHSFPIAPLFDDFVQLLAKLGTTYTPTLLVSYGGPWAENYYYTTENVHDDPRLRRFVPHTEIDKLTRRRPWFHEEEHVFKTHAAQAAKIVAAGGKVGIGGHGQLQGLGYHWELWSVQSGGMSEIDALRCATIFGAQAIGFGTDLGSLEVGKLADVVVLDKNPLDNIRNTTSVRYVMKNGILYNALTLDQIWPREKKLGSKYWEE